MFDFIRHYSLESLPEQDFLSHSLNQIQHFPPDYVIVAQNERSDRQSDHAVISYYRECMLVDASNRDVVFQHVDKLIDYDRLGVFTDIGTRYHHTYCDGLTNREAMESEPDYLVHFFAQIRYAVGTDAPTVDFSQPFIWFWDAYQIKNQWFYTDKAGNRHELARITYDQSTHQYRLEIRTRELRTFLACYQKVLFVRDDIGICRDDSFSDKIDRSISGRWFKYHLYSAVMDTLKNQNYLGFEGWHILEGKVTDARPRFMNAIDEFEYPVFIIGVNDNGENVKYSCDPTKLNKAGSPLYLQPVFFTPDVLEQYRNTDKYCVTDTDIECIINGHVLWGIDAEQNSEGLVQVYLGDLGTKLPGSERKKWIPYNTFPVGDMNPNRIKRDFLGLWTDTGDTPISELFLQFKNARRVVIKRFGASLWRDLDQQTQKEYSSLAIPLVNSVQSFHQGMLIIAKVFVDSLDSKFLDQYVSKGEKNEGTLSKFKRLCINYQLDLGLYSYLHSIYRYRSAGGAAHLPNSESPKVRKNLGLEDNVTPKHDFAFVCQKLAGDLQIFSESVDSMNRQNN